MKSGIAVLLSVALAAAANSRAGAVQSRDDLATARQAAQWIESTAIANDKGVVWPSDPEDPKSVGTTLYAGTPGPILFLLETYRYTGDERALADAKKGADALIDSIANTEGTGLYEGLAGTGFTLGEAYLVTHDARYRDGALRCIELLKTKSKTAGAGIEWADGPDIIAGAAGTGLFLLWADEKLKAPGARELAVAAGRRLVEIGESKEPGKTDWRMSPKYPDMPNFAHGTAGVAYFLATLYVNNHDKQFLDAAVAGANYLISIADLQHGACLIYHDDKRKNLYYLSWCHGPAGDARLFYQLYRATHDAKWLDWVKRSATAMIASGAPDVVVKPGEWNNISACCGVTGQAQFFLDAYEVTHDAQYLELARKATARLLSSATLDQSGARWVQAETRVKPDLLQAQTGFMQGASGVGMWLLHMGEFTAGVKKAALTFPDNPFAY